MAGGSWKINGRLLCPREIYAPKNAIQCWIWKRFHPKRSYLAWETEKSATNYCTFSVGPWHQKELWFFSAFLAPHPRPRKLDGNGDGLISQEVVDLGSAWVGLPEFHRDFLLGGENRSHSRNQGQGIRVNSKSDLWYFFLLQGVFQFPNGKHNNWFERKTSLVKGLILIHTPSAGIPVAKKEHHLVIECNWALKWIQMVDLLLVVFVLHHFTRW